MSKKWDNYTIGNIKWINRNRHHPHRDVFVDYVVNNNINSVIEIGAGELTEYQKIIDKCHRELDYTVVDISNTFLDYCRKNYPEVKTIQKNIEEISSNEIHYRRDIVYLASVLEHVSDVESSIKNILSTAYEFHFVMFKWKYDGDLTPTYNKKKEYWSSVFNVYKIMDIINKIGDINESFVVMKDNSQKIEFYEYSKNKSGTHRTGDYLVIRGKC